MAPGEENEAWIAGQLKTLDGLLQVLLPQFPFG